MRAGGWVGLGFSGKLFAGAAVALAVSAAGQTIAVNAQAGVGCGADGYRVTARQWDAVLGRGWELRQSCAHPEWPARAVAVGAGSLPVLAVRTIAAAQVAAGVARAGQAVQISPASPTAQAVQVAQPLLVRAGEEVRLWSQGERVRIEMSGVAEQSARNGERVVVRVTRQTDDAGLTVERIAGTVRGAGDVEMER